LSAALLLTHWIWAIVSNGAIISLTFDDGLRCQFDKALPLLDKYRIPATFFLIANQYATHDRWLGHTNDWWKLTWSKEDVSMLKEIVRNGHEIGSHSVSHHPTQIEMNPEFEAQKSKELIESWIESEVNSFCYPFYRSHFTLSSAVKRSGYQQARGGGTPPKYEPGASYYPHVGHSGLDRFNVDSRQISTSEDVSKWIRPGCWHVLTFHGIGDECDGWEPIAVENFANLLDELALRLQRGEAEVLTFNDAVQRICSICTERTPLR
jgi:peptidoglycan/xylan/chitin deacetylase (PgdA/CDA1 family)